MVQALSAALTVPTLALDLTASAACPSLMLRFSFRVSYWALRLRVSLSRSGFGIVGRY